MEILKQRNPLIQQTLVLRLIVLYLLFCFKNAIRSDDYIILNIL